MPNKHQLVITVEATASEVPSTTTLDGDLAIRVNITNHRTQNKDLDILVKAVTEIGDKLSESLGTS